MAEPHDVLVDTTWCQRDYPALRRCEQVGHEVADLHNREVVRAGIEAEGAQLMREVVRLPARREDRADAGRRYDRDVAADRVSPPHPHDLPRERNPLVF